MKATIKIVFHTPSGRYRALYQGGWVYGPGFGGCGALAGRKFRATLLIPNAVYERNVEPHGNNWIVVGVNHKGEITLPKAPKPIKRPFAREEA